MTNPPPPSAAALRAQIQEVKRIRKHAVSIIKNGGAEGALANLTRDVCDVLLALIPHAVGEEPVELCQCGHIGAKHTGNMVGDHCRVLKCGCAKYRPVAGAGEERSYGEADGIRESRPSLSRGVDRSPSEIMPSSPSPASVPPTAHQAPQPHHPPKGEAVEGRVERWLLRDVGGFTYDTLFRSVDDAIAYSHRFDQKLAPYAAVPLVELREGEEIVNADAYALGEAYRIEALSSRIEIASLRARLREGEREAVAVPDEGEATT